MPPSEAQLPAFRNKELVRRKSPIPDPVGGPGDGGGVTRLALPHLRFDSPPLQLRFDTSECYRQIDGLDDVVVGTQCQRFHDVVTPTSARDHDDGQYSGRAFDADALEYPIAVHRGHSDVQQHDVELVLPDQLERLDARRCLPRPVATLLELTDQQVPDGCVVIDDKQHRRMGRVDDRDRTQEA